MTEIVDTHLHARAIDDVTFPALATAPDPAAGIGETANDALVAMDGAGVAAAVLVQWNSRHGFDNNYAATMAQRHPGRFSSVCSVRVTAPDATETTSYWLTERRMAGIRFFNGFAPPASTGPTLDLSVNELFIDQPPSRALLELAHGAHATITLMSSLPGLAHVRRAAEMHPEVPLLLDHLAGVTDVQPLEPLACLPNIYLKFSTGVLANRHAGPLSGDALADERALLQDIVRLFGAERLLWGSNYPQTPIQYKTLVQLAYDLLSFMSPDEVDAALGGNAQRFWPSLKP